MHCERFTVEVGGLATGLVALSNMFFYRKRLVV
jgi:hypothetical protein